MLFRSYGWYSGAAFVASQPSPDNESRLASLAKLDRIVRLIVNLEKGVQVNILEAKNQLSRLIKAAAAGEEVIIASNGTPVVRLVPVQPKTGLTGRGILKRYVGSIDAAFATDVEAEVARGFHGI